MSDHVHMTAAIIDGNDFETIRYPTDDIHLRAVSYTHLRSAMAATSAISSCGWPIMK